jgi:hypothetical protein
LYVKLYPGIKAAQIEKQIDKLYKKYKPNDPSDHSTTWYLLQPLSDLHFNADYGAYGMAVANKPTLYGLLSVAALWRVWHGRG